MVGSKNKYLKDKGKSRIQRKKNVLGLKYTKVRQTTGQNKLALELVGRGLSVEISLGTREQGRIGK